MAQYPSAVDTLVSVSGKMARARRQWTRTELPEPGRKGMSRLSGGNYYEQLGARPVINAEGNASYLGGSLQSAAI